MTGELYADRESINPRAFAVRHLVIQEVKFRKLGLTDSAAVAQLDRVARGVDVIYTSATHTMTVACEGAEIRRIPLDGLALYVHGPHVDAPPGIDARHWDTALEENRAFVRSMVNEMLQHLSTPTR